MQTIEFTITPRHLEEKGNGEAKPVPLTNLKAALEGARDRWLRETPQLTDDEAKVLAENVANAAQVIRGAAPGSDNADRQKLRDAVAAHRAAIAKNNSSTLDEHHKAAVALISTGIDAAVSLASSPVYEGKNLRVSITGHYDTSDDGIYTRPRVRCNVHVDIAG
jgi:hypothetical protein